MKNLVVAAAIASKLHKKHHVSINEVEQCFVNKVGNLLYDTRAKTKTIPPTLWVIA